MAGPTALGFGRKAKATGTTTADDEATNSPTIWYVTETHDSVVSKYLEEEQTSETMKSVSDANLVTVEALPSTHGAETTVRTQMQLEEAGEDAPPREDMQAVDNPPVSGGTSLIAADSEDGASKRTESEITSVHDEDDTGRYSSKGDRDDATEPTGRGVTGVFDELLKKSAPQPWCLLREIEGDIPIGCDDETGSPFTGRANEVSPLRSSDMSSASSPHVSPSTGGQRSRQSSSGSDDQSQTSLESETKRIGSSAQSGSDNHDNQAHRHPSSPESGGEEDEQQKIHKRENKQFFIAKEIMTSERVFVDVLVLLNVDFRDHIARATAGAGRAVVPDTTLARILSFLPQLQTFNEQLLYDLERRIENWDEEKKIADIFIKKGQFLKMWSSSYIEEFETRIALLDDALQKYPAFKTALDEFEKSPRCAKLGLKHYMLKPVQRLPQYRLFMEDYKKHLSPDSPELTQIQTALHIMSEVAEHANTGLKHRKNRQKLLEIQQSLNGDFEVIKPGRELLKEGGLTKLSRKEKQPRFLFLFNDILLCTIPAAVGFRLRHVIQLAGMRVTENTMDEFNTEFSIISKQRSFTVTCSNTQERDEWISALNSAIEENKRNRKPGRRSMVDPERVGDVARPWVPDNRATMCMICTSDFTWTWRRHHCRACGRVVCGNCSDSKAPLKFKKDKPSRVCVECYQHLVGDQEKTANGQTEAGDPHSWKNGTFGIFRRIKQSSKLPRLTEVHANDPNVDISGYLSQFMDKRWQKKFSLVKGNVLYSFKASNDSAAKGSLAIVGYEVSTFSQAFEGTASELLFQLSHPNRPSLVFRTKSAEATQRWVNALKAATMI